MKILRSARLNTPLGWMVAVGDSEALFLLEFEDSSQLERLCQNLRATIHSGRAESVDAVENELELYFEGKLTQFQTPLVLTGTDFQKRVWLELRKIPFGETRSYLDLAVAIGKPTAFRAVALANGANRFPILIPCHRVIRHCGSLGGYSGGIDRKRRLLDLENSANCP